MPLSKNGFEWYTPEEAMELLIASPNAPIRMTVEGWEEGVSGQIRTSGFGQQGSMGYYLIRFALNHAPYWRFMSNPPTPPFVLDEQLTFS